MIKDHEVIVDGWLIGVGRILSTVDPDVRARQASELRREIIGARNTLDAEGATASVWQRFDLALSLLRNAMSGKAKGQTEPAAAGLGSDTALANATVDFPFSWGGQLVSVMTCKEGLT